MHYEMRQAAEHLEFLRMHGESALREITATFTIFSPSTSLMSLASGSSVAIASVNQRWLLLHHAMALLGSLNPLNAPAYPPIR